MVEKVYNPSGVEASRSQGLLASQPSLLGDQLQTPILNKQNKQTNKEVVLEE